MEDYDPVDLRPEKQWRQGCPYSYPPIRAATQRVVLFT